MSCRLMKSNVHRFVGSDYFPLLMKCIQCIIFPIFNFILEKIYFPSFSKNMKLKKILIMNNSQK